MEHKHVKGGKNKWCTFDKNHEELDAFLLLEKC